MILLDTDHLTVVSNERHSRHLTLLNRLEDSDDPEVGTAIVSVEEQFRGWLARISRSRDIHHAGSEDRFDRPGPRRLAALRQPARLWPGTGPARGELVDLEVLA